MRPTTKQAGWLAIAITAVCAYEGLSLKEYPDIGRVPTICYGETRGVQPGDVATKAQCDKRLSERLVEFNQGVDSCVTADLPNKRRASFVSLSYNIGVSAFCKSTVVRRINAGDVAGACEAVMMWDKVKGKHVQGLTNRRKRERDMCQEGLTQ